MMIGWLEIWLIRLLQSLVVEKVSADQRKRLEEENPPSRNPASHVQDYLGFTQVIRHITEKKKVRN